MSIRSPTLNATPVFGRTVSAIGEALLSVTSFPASVSTREYVVPVHALMLWAAS